MPTIDATKVTALISKASKLVPSSEMLTLDVRPDGVGVEIMSQSDGSMIVLTDREAILDKAGDPVKVGVPPGVLTASLKSRKALSVTLDGSTLTLKDGRYRASLATVPPAPIKFPTDPSQLKEIGGLREVIDAHLSRLSLYSTAEAKLKEPMVNVEWDGGVFKAAVTDVHHTVYVTGPVSLKGKGGVNLRSSDLAKISAMGGRFALEGNRVIAASDDGMMSFQREPAGSGEFSAPLAKIETLVNSPSTWECDIQVDDMIAALNNVEAVIDDKSGIKFAAHPKGGFLFKAKGRHGTISARVAADLPVKAKKVSVVLNIHQLHILVGRMAGTVRFAAVGNSVRMDCVGKDIRIIGMLAIMASDE